MERGRLIFQVTTEDYKGGGRIMLKVGFFSVAVELWLKPRVKRGT